MDVVAHQDVGVYLAIELACLFAQVTKELEVVDFKDEAWPTVDAALDDVLGNTWQVES
jgi:hypothetical protein